MPLNLKDLDEQTREFMIEEIEHDINNGTLYISPRLTEGGVNEYPTLLRTAIENGNDDSLATNLRSHGLLKETEQRNTRGGITIAKVPITAADTLAEGEFNRFYIRGLCRRAIKNGIQELIIYRAKEVSNPRPESEARLGKSIDSETLLQDLRKNPGVEPALGLPSGPNSGLSVRLP